LTGELMAVKQKSLLKVPKIKTQHVRITDIDSLEANTATDHLIQREVKRWKHHQSRFHRGRQADRQFMFIDEANERTRTSSNQLTVIQTHGTYIKYRAYVKVMRIKFVHQNQGVSW